jgi:hypothetical protein
VLSEKKMNYRVNRLLLGEITMEFVKHVLVA